MAVTSTINDSALPRLDIRSAFVTAPEPLDFVLPGMLAGTVGALIAPGGTGKSWFALELAMAVAGGPDLLEMSVDDKYGGVLYLAAEDPALAITHRLHSVGYVVRDSIGMVAENLEIIPLMGRPVNLLLPAWAEALKRMGTGKRLIILDTLRRFHVADENNGGDMAALLSVLEDIAQVTGASIMFLHHAAKGASLSGSGDVQQASRGSSVLVDNVRGGQINLVGMTDAEAQTYGVTDRRMFVRAVQSKVNFGCGNSDQWYRRDTGGVLVPARLERQEPTPTTRRPTGRARGNA